MLIRPERRERKVDIAGDINSCVGNNILVCPQARIGFLVPHWEASPVFGRLLPIAGRLAGSGGDHGPKRCFGATSGKVKSEEPSPV